MISSKKKKMEKNIKAKRIKMHFKKKKGCKLVSRRCGSYIMYLEGDSPHQAVMIVCELN